MKSRLLLCFSLLTCSLAHAADSRSIEVTAQSSVKVVPDEVRLGLAVDITAETLLEAKQKNDTISAAIIALAPKFKVLPPDVEVTNMHVPPNYRSSSSFGREAGGTPISYDFKRSVEMRLTDFDQLEPLRTLAFQAGLTNVAYLQFRVSNQREHQFKVREQAVHFAKEKVEHLVSLTKMKLGSPITIPEVQLPRRGLRRFCCIQ